ncbi:hypothetical protein DY000_02023071 [Brassica cretica]|uniref:NADH:quinone oxidoreductase/Mrp antiporter membrane subunit domain-containing protein n=1 Tax=Brassica cretica TaxID=69181 RepID=A0ABQ7EB08_BRACR|nr:hypothetical protein DY000_02023071 [Brassica cretica]
MSPKAWIHIRVGDMMGSSPPPDVEPVSMIIGSQSLSPSGLPRPVSAAGYFFIVSALLTVEFDIGIVMI